MPENDVSPTDRAAALSRRGVLLGAAWSAPVIAAAIASPAASASGESSPGTISFDSASYMTTSLSVQMPITGSVSAISGTWPATIALLPSAGFGSPRTVAVEQSGGTFFFQAWATTQPKVGTITASGAGYTSAMATLTALSLGDITFDSSAYSVTGASATFTVSGRVSVRSSMPTNVFLIFPSGFTGNAVAPVDHGTGTFSAVVTGPAKSATGTLHAMQSGFGAGQTTLTASVS
jgi:hypothetical protein